MSRRMIELRGKSILITGASSGIGRATALACARAGMKVAAAARRADRLESLVSEIRSGGGEGMPLALDVTDAKACEEGVQRTSEAFGGLYAVFANAGYGVERAVHEMSDADVRAMFEANLFGCLNVIRPALPGMIERRAGHVLMCASSIGKVGIPYYGVYCATKAAQTTIGRAMRHELSPMGVHVSTVHPVLTRTEFAEVSQSLSGGVRMADRMPKLMMQTPERVASAVVACLRRPRGEVWTSWTSRLAMGALSTFPLIADIALGRFARGHDKQEKRVSEG